MKDKMIRLIQGILGFLSRPLKEKYVLKPALGMTLLASMVFLISFEVLMYSQRGLGQVLWLVSLTFGLLVGGFYLVALFLQVLKEVPVSLALLIGPGMAGFYFMLSSNRSPYGVYIGVLVCVGFMFSVAYYGMALWHMVKHKAFLPLAKPYKVIVHLLTLVTSIGLYYIFISGGLPDRLYDNAFDTYKTDLVVKELEATLDVKTGVYGSQAYINQYGDAWSEESFSSNINYFVGAFGDSKAQHLGFNVRNAPLNAHYYLPQGPGPYPLVVLVHGNHEMVESSEIGYGYLGHYLASRGYAVVSVDENYLNYSFYDSEVKQDSLGGENDARAYLLLEHIRYLGEANSNASSGFYKMFDMDAIALIGHSRGGEAVSIAEFFNHTRYLPSHSKKKLARNYNIKSLVAIAPTDGQYMPGQRPNALTDVNYLLLHGSHDMDVTYMAGLNQYERVTFDKGHHFKSQVMIYGANHGQFNDQWRIGDNNPLADHLHNTGQLISRPDQEATASQLISYFLEATLKGDESYEVGFRNLKAFVDLPSNLYLSQYHASEDMILADYNEDNYLETMAYEPGVIYQDGLSHLYEGRANLDGRTSQVYGAYMSTAEARRGKYTLEFLDGGLDASAYSHIFITLSDETDKSRESYDFDVMVTDSQGRERRLGLSSYGKVQHKLDIVLSKFEFIDKQLKDESMFQTFELAFDSFDTEAFDWHHLRKISLILPQGEKRKIFIKDIGIR